MLVVFFGMFGFFFLNASLLQYGRGFTVLQAGLGVLPMSAPLLIAARHVPRLVARTGNRAVLAAAFAAITVGLLGTASAIHQPYEVYAVWLVVLGVGITLALPTLTITISAALPPAKAGVAGGLQATTREFGSALGVAVIGTILTATFTHHAGGGVGTVAEALGRAGADRRVVLSAYDASVRTALQIAAVIVLVAGVLVLAEMSWAARRRTPATGSGPAAVSRD